jgi:2-enoate reductase
VEKEKVSTAIDLLLGKKKTQGKVLVLGGGLIGCETALWLAQQEKKVALVEVLNDLMVAGIPVQHMNRLMLLDLLKYYKVEVLTNTSVVEVMEGGVLLQDRDSRKKEFPADTVVLAVGLKPNRELYQILRGQTANLFFIGDSRKTQNIMGSIWDAYEVARMI